MKRLVSLLLLVPIFSIYGDGAEKLWKAGDYAIQLREKRGEWPVEYLLEVKRADTFIREVVLRSKDLTLERAWVSPNGRVVASGAANSNAQHLLVEGEKTGKSIWIRTWKYSVSPSGLYIALQEFFSGHGGDWPHSITVFDLEASVPGQESQADQSLIPIDCAGRVVFPEQSSFPNSCRELKAPEGQAKLASPFLWRQDEDQEVLFFLYFEDQEIFLVRILGPFSGVEPPTIWRQQVNLRARYDPKSAGFINFENGLKFWADNLSWTSAGKIKVELDPGYGFGSSFELSAD